MDEQIVAMNVRLPLPLRQWLTDEALKQRRSVNAQVQVILERAKENAPTAGTVEAS